MIGVDTNVLLRLLIDDNPPQCEKARAFFAARSADDPAFVSATVLAELIWLLRRRFRYTGQAILDALRSMTSTEEILFEHNERLRTFLESEGHTVSDIAEALIGWSCARAKCSKVATFDKRSAKLIPSMELLS